MSADFSWAYRCDQFRELGLPVEFAQDNHSRSAKGVLRGLALSVGADQWSAAWCGCRWAAPFWWRSISGAGVTQLWTLGEESMLGGKPASGVGPGRLCPRILRALRGSPRCSTSAPGVYNPGAESGILWNDPAIGIDVAGSEIRFCPRKSRRAPAWADWMGSPQWNQSRYQPQAEVPLLPR